MGFKCGIVGLPNVGKSTLFNALTKAAIAAQNYPFCTIDPHVGIVNVPDKRLHAIASIVNPQQILPTTMEIVDIAGLVKGASLGEGLGNKFLANIRETDAILHVVRCFESSDIIHVAGKVDPIADIDTIDTELLLADLDTLDKAILRVGKHAKSGNKDAIAEKTLFEHVKAELDKGIPLRLLTLSDEERQRIKPLFLLTQKPVLYIANVSDDGFETNPLLDAVIERASSEGSKVVSISAETEAALIDMSDEEKAQFMEELGLGETGLDKLIREGYALLGLQTYFTAGVKEVRAWTIKIGDTAPMAAGVIHSDFERGFIRAEVVAYDDFIAHKGEQGAKEAGRLRLEGKQYVVSDGDVMHFLFNV